MKLVILIMVFMCTSSAQGKEASVPVWVSRRSSNDLYKTFGDDKSTVTVCDNNKVNITILVGEKRCVRNRELFSACSSPIIPVRATLSENSIAFLDFSRISVDNSTTVIGADTNDTVFVVSETSQPINNSFCRISSLEVYRGREQAIKISHEGFSLNDNGTINVDTGELTYKIEEYKGELYRMNLYCSGGAQNGCLFFKVIGDTSVTNAKFNCTVPGTLADFNEECNITTTSTISEATSPTTTLHITTTGTISLTKSGSSGFELGGIYFIVVVISGVLAVVLLVGIVLAICLIVCILRRKILRPSSAVGEGGKEPIPQDLDTKPDNIIYSTLMAQEYETVIRDGESHIYAALETPQNSHQYADPIKNLNKTKECPNTAQTNEQQQQQQVPGAQCRYETPNMKMTPVEPHLIEGLSDNTSEHKYAVLERQPLAQQPQEAVHHYDDPPREDNSRLHPSEEHSDPENHIYAVLEKTQ